MTVNKVVDSAAAAVADIPDGASLAVGGFGLAGIPWILTEALLHQGAADLTVVATTLGAVPAPQLGPVGARFLTAFASAVAAHSAAVTALGAGSAHAGAVARDNADAYDAAGHRARRMLPQV